MSVLTSVPEPNIWQGILNGKLLCFCYPSSLKKQKGIYNSFNLTVKFCNMNLFFHLLAPRIWLRSVRFSLFSFAAQPQVFGSFVKQGSTPALKTDDRVFKPRLRLHPHMVDPTYGQPFERKTSANAETGMAHFSILWQGTLPVQVAPYSAVKYCNSRQGHPRMLPKSDEAFIDLSSHSPNTNPKNKFKIAK